MDSVLFDDYGVWSDFHYLVRTRFPMLQLVLAEFCHAIGDWCARCQGRFVCEDSFASGKLRFGWYPFVAVPFLLRLISARSRVYLLLQCADPTFQ